MSDVTTRLSTINVSFLQGLLDVDQLASITLDNFDLTTASVLAAVQTSISTDITVANFPVASMANVSRQVLNLGAHIAKLLGAAAFTDPKLIQVATNYGLLFTQCIRDDNGKGWQQCPLMRSPAFAPAAGASSKLVADASGGTYTYFNADPMDFSGGSNAVATTRLAQVVNTYTFKRMAIYAVLSLNASVIAYDMIVNSGAGVSNDVLKQMFQFNQQQFATLNSLYVPVTSIDMASWETVAPATVDQCNASAALCGATSNLGAAAWGQTGLPLYANANSASSGHTAMDAFTSKGWVSSSGATIGTPTVWGALLPFNLSPSDHVVIAPVGSTNAYTVYVQRASAATVLNQLPLTLSTPAAVVTSQAGVNDITLGSTVASGSSAVWVSATSVGGQTNAGTGFTLSFPRAPLSATAPLSAPSGSSSRYSYVWAGVEDRLYPAASAVGANAQGWRAPVMTGGQLVTPANGTGAITSGAYWAAAPKNAANQSLSLIAYTVAPSSAFGAPSGWDVYVSTTSVTANQSPNSFTWTLQQTDTPTSPFTASQTFKLSAATPFTAVLLAPFGGTATARTYPEGTGFGSVSLEVQEPNAADPKDYNLMNDMAVRESGFQKDVRALDTQTHAFRRSQAKLSRASAVTRSSEAAARRSRTVMWVYLAIALAISAATVGLLAIGAAGPHGATPALAALALLGVVACVVLQFLSSS